MSAQEQVLGIPTQALHQAGIFQGFTRRIEHYLPKLLDPALLSYRPRGQAEEDPTFKQIIPYVVLRYGGQVFNYVRGSKGSESRLRALRSIGVGGHINPGDHTLFEDPFREGMLREVHEEVVLESDYRETCLGLINDDSTPVGQVHLGVVYVFDLTSPAVRRRETGLTRSGFDELSALLMARGEFETWSQFILEALK